MIYISPIVDTPETFLEIVEAFMTERGCQFPSGDAPEEVIGEIDESQYPIVVSMSTRNPDKMYWTELNDFEEDTLEEHLVKVYDDSEGVHEAQAFDMEKFKNL